MAPIRAIAALALCAIAGLSGCTSSTSGDPSTSASPSVTSMPTSAPPSTVPSSDSSVPSTDPATPTVPTDVPTTGPNAKPGERPPVMPVAATKHTAAGARAFAKFFLQTIDWGYATTSSTYMKRYFQPSCGECRIVRYSLDNARRDGQHYVGGRVAINSVGAAIRGGGHGADYSIKVSVDISAIETIDRKGNASNPDVAYRGFNEATYVRWLRGAWTTVWLHGKSSAS